MVNDYFKWPFIIGFIVEFIFDLMIEFTFDLHNMS